MQNLQTILARISWDDERGQTFVEYALVLTVIVVGVLLAVSFTGLGTGLTNAINDVKDHL
jgi:Flp pilus assembly pilin Flp